MRLLGWAAVIGGILFLAFWGDFVVQMMMLPVLK